ncbi:3-deoxy-D-manno-octulosonic acid transferase [Pseudodesulfovibrio piezophilus]|uniref:3-deoxy-D-manno-octulosonic acid transferase n=1 Tax=Pseudodesulfovibrio piezophilus (strain DSM 21447 / JCM 15486 / C1TLV30) TaxID=1322246 RepID=M1WYQ5_PSEP2|nr:glycosyltransferase N-terminal domain-containing protein [Pseudodesulfovibrio piezophilus]CCH50503.1 Three-deoxy-D-manno-octulosonic-acid transferase domain protein [Pseudodesulfovibrio piezophilus C1TLV30]
MGKALIDATLSAYGVVWKAALPLLKLNHRLKEGWDQRTLNGGVPAPAHIWIQAASGGEAYLAWEVLKELRSPFTHSLRVLVTTNTLQGYETLCRAAQEINASQSGLAIQPWYFPFDSPAIMRRMVGHVRPQAALILETEIWPGFLNACKEYGVRILLANGRMSPKSLGGYMAWPTFFRTLGPDRIMAVSQEDGRRFGTIFGRDKVWVMPNIKFDRMAEAGPMSNEKNPLRDVIPVDADFVVFGSVRKQELAAVSHLAAGLMRQRPTTILGLFPRHLHHVSLWKKALNDKGIHWVLRSESEGKARPGTVILWDTFGELFPAYGLAKAAFVGGSLAPLGGQNFLEPLTCGVTPVTGPHWKNFAWVGREIIENGLALEAADGAEALDSLITTLDNPLMRTEVVKRAKAYIHDRLGGAAAVAKQVADFLNKD